MAASRGYHSYRGRGPKWKIFLAIFLIAVILGSVAVILLQGTVVFDENGKPQVQLPWKREEQPAPEEPDDVDLTIEEPPVSKPNVYTTLQLSDTPLTTADGVLSQAQIDGCDAVAVTVKAGGGTIYFDTTVPEAQAFVRAESGTAAALSALTESDLHVTARLSCFLDFKASNANVETMGLKNTGGYLFYDGRNQTWLDPAKPAARQYLCDLAKDLEAQGFDEILLTDVSYPTVGKLNKIAYSEEDHTEGFRLFLTELRSALNEDTMLSIELPAEVLTTGADETAGLSLAALAPLVNAVYAETDDGSAAALSEAVTAASAEQAVFVPEFDGKPTTWLGGYLLKSAE